MRRRSPISGRELCAAKPPTAAQRFRSTSRLAVARGARRRGTFAKSQREVRGADCRSNPLGGPVRFRIAAGEGSEDPRARFWTTSETKAGQQRQRCMSMLRNRATGEQGESANAQRSLAAQRGGADVVLDEKGSSDWGCPASGGRDIKPGHAGRQFRLPLTRLQAQFRRPRARRLPKRKNGHAASPRSTRRCRMNHYPL